MKERPKPLLIKGVGWGRWTSFYWVFTYSWCTLGMMCTLTQLCSVMSNSFWPHGLLPARLPFPMGFPGKNTGVGCHFLLQENFLTQGSNPHPLHLLHWQTDSSLMHRVHQARNPKMKCLQILMCASREQHGPILLVDQDFFPWPNLSQVFLSSLLE